MPTVTTADGTEIFYKDWAIRRAHRLQSRLAAVQAMTGTPS